MLQPTDQTKIEEFYCAHDSHSGGGDSFHEAIAKVFKTVAIFIFISILFDFLIKVGEDDHWLGTGTESWGEVAFIIFYNQDIFGTSPFFVVDLCCGRHFW